MPWPVPTGPANQHVVGGARALVQLVGLLSDLREILALGATA